MSLDKIKYFFEDYGWYIITGLLLVLVIGLSIGYNNVLHDFKKCKNDSTSLTESLQSRCQVSSVPVISCPTCPTCNPTEKVVLVNQTCDIDIQCPSKLTKCYVRLEYTQDMLNTYIATNNTAYVENLTQTLQKNRYKLEDCTAKLDNITSLLKK